MKSIINYIYVLKYNEFKTIIDIVVPFLYLLIKLMCMLYNDELLKT